MPRAQRLAALLSAAFLIFGCSPAERNESGEIVGGGALDAFAMQVGDCFNDQMFGSDEVTDVPGTPCSEAHDNEVFALFDVTMSEFPGDDAISGMADEGCYDRFQRYVGATYEESVLAITHLVPSREAWLRAKDREVVCVVYHMDLDKLHGSVRGTGM